MVGGWNSAHALSVIMVGGGNSGHALFVIMVHTEEPAHSFSVITPDLMIKEFRSTRTRSLDASGAL
jgi:hypothetical protein